MKAKISILLVSIFLSINAVFAQDGRYSSNSLSLMFVGDVMGHSPQITSAYNEATNTYSYDSVFMYMENVFSLADIVIANLEVTLAGEPYSGYPQFSSPDELVDALMVSGVDAVVNANNHSADRGKQGILRTIDVLNMKGMPHTGTFSSKSQRDSLYPLIIDKNGIRLALLNYTYGTNGIEVPEPVIVNRIDTAIIRADYLKTKDMGVDDVIAFVHWGNEYERTPAKTQESLAVFMHKLGIRIVIGSHPHVIQRMEATYDTDSTYGSVTVYSLGNFVSNQRKRYCNGGVLAFINLKKDELGKVKIDGSGYIPVWVNIPYRNGKRIYEVLPIAEFEKNQDKYLSTVEDSILQEFASDTRFLLDSQNVNFPEVKNENGKWIVPWLKTDSVPKITIDYQEQ